MQRNWNHQLKMYFPFIAILQMLIYIGANTVSKTLRTNFSINLSIDIKELEYEPKSWSAILECPSLLRDNSITLIKVNLKIQWFSNKNYPRKIQNLLKNVNILFLSN